MPLVERYLESSLLRWLVLALAVSGAYLLTFGLPHQFPTPYRIDFDVYRTGAQVFLEGGALYGPMPELTQGAHLPFTYPPIAAAVFSIFAILPLWLGSTLLTVASIGSITLVLRLVLGRTCHRPANQVWWLVAAAVAGGLWLGPMRDTLAYGQINALLMALVMVDALAGRGKWWGGALIGLAISIKLTPVVFLLLLVLRRDWRAAATAVVSFLACTAIGHLLAPRDSSAYWTQVLPDTGRIGGAAYAANQSINAVLARLGLQGGALTLAWFVASMIVGLLVAWVAWRLLAHGHHVAATIIVGFSALFCSPVSWGHHWVWALPLIALLIVWASRRNGDTERWFWLAGSGALLFSLNPHWWFPNEDNAELQWNALQHVVGSSYLVWSLVGVVMIGLSAHRLGPADLDCPSSVSETQPPQLLQRN